MGDRKAYIILHFDQHAGLSVVYQTHSIKDARHYLSYRASPQDALFLTTVHPSYSGDGVEPQYVCHLVSRGKLLHNEEDWMTRPQQMVAA